MDSCSGLCMATHTRSASLCAPSLCLPLPPCWSCSSQPLRSLLAAPCRHRSCGHCLLLARDSCRPSIARPRPSAFPCGDPCCTLLPDADTCLARWRGSPKPPATGGLAALWRIPCAGTAPLSCATRPPEGRRPAGWPCPLSWPCDAPSLAMRDFMRLICTHASDNRI